MKLCGIVVCLLVSSGCILPAAEKVYGTDHSNDPAHIVVSDQVRLKDPGPWSVCVPSDELYNVNASWSYEPISFNNLMQAPQDSDKRIDLAHNWWNATLSTGFYDGAQVHVCRIIDGKWTVVKRDTVESYVSSDWYLYGSKLGQLMYGKAVLIPAGGTFRFPAKAEWQRDKPIYIGLASFNKNCVVSETANCSVQLGELAVDKKGRTPRAAKGDAYKKLALLKPKPQEQASAGPSQIQARYDDKTQLIELQWTDSPDSDVLGYALYVSYLPPEEHKGNYMELAGAPANDQEKIKKDDLVFVRKQFYTSDIQKNMHGVGLGGFKGTPGVPFENGKDAPGAWSLVAHPQPLPSTFENPGKTCLKVEMEQSVETSIQIAKFQKAGKWYAPLLVGKTYRVEGWFRQEKMERGEVRFEVSGKFGKTILPTQAHAVDGTWKQLSYEFTVPAEMTSSIGYVHAHFSGTGTLWADNLRMYKTDQPFMETDPWHIETMKSSGMYWWRDHTYIKTKAGYTLDDLLAAPGMTSYKGFSKTNKVATLPAWLSPVEKTGMQPWFQVEMFFDEDDWLGFIEYIAAPYDPKSDSPETKPWAYKRFQQGHHKPWSDSFDKLMFEVSNETWNGPFAPWVFMGISMTDATTGRTYKDGELLGLYQEWMIDVYEKSPYWKNIKEKSEFAVGGWFGPLRNGRINGYGADTVSLSPRSDWLTVAVYNGGWDTGEGPVAPNDPSYFNTMMNVPWSTQAAAIKIAGVQKALAEQGHAVRLGTYEAGPGYQIQGLNNIAKIDQAKVMTSQCSGVATLDTFLCLAYDGNFEMQVYFGYGASSDMAIFQSHMRSDFSGAAFPSWKLMELYNTYGQGDYLTVSSESVPTIDLPKYKRRRALKNAPLVASYATRKGDRLSLFVLSRKIDGYPRAEDDGYTPVTVQLPISGAKKITAHSMTGALREHNLYEDRVGITTTELPTHILKDGSIHINSESGSDDRGLPPGSLILYVFEGID